MHRAQELGNVSQACREAGISRSLFYRWRQRSLAYGSDGLHPRRTAAVAASNLSVHRLAWDGRFSFSAHVFK